MSTCVGEFGRVLSLLREGSVEMFVMIFLNARLGSVVFLAALSKVPVIFLCGEVSRLQVPCLGDFMLLCWIFSSKADVKGLRLRPFERGVIFAVVVSETQGRLENTAIKSCKSTCFWRKRVYRGISGFRRVGNQVADVFKRAYGQGLELVGIEKLLNFFSAFKSCEETLSVEMRGVIVLD